MSLGLSAYDDVPWIQALMDYIKQILSHGNVKIIGLCFGHQLVGRVLGAESGKNSSGYEMSVCNVSLSPLGSKVFGKSEIVSISTLQKISRFWSKLEYPALILCSNVESTCILIFLVLLSRVKSSPLIV